VGEGLIPFFAGKLEAVRYTAGPGCSVHDDDMADAFAYGAKARGRYDWFDLECPDQPHTLWYKHQGVGLDAVNTIYLRWSPGSRLAQECRRFTPGQSGHSEAMAARLEEIAKNLRQGQSVTDAKEALLWLCAAESERRREGPSTVDAQAHEVVDVQALGPA
jgi:hypothetical protein